jgi:drug/metabolite transporter (DMT)-like permease
MQRAAPRMSSRAALVALLTGAAAIGFAPIFVRWSEVGPSATAFWRIALALPVLGLWMAAERRRLTAATSPADRKRLLLAGLFFAADLSVWHWSIGFTSVANATLLANFAPVFVTLGGWLLLGQAVTRRFVLGMAIALLGAWLLMGGQLTAGGLGSRRLLGDGLGLLTAVFYAGYILGVAELRQRCSTATIMVWTGVACAPALLLAALGASERLLPETATGWWVLVALALVNQVLGQSLIAAALAVLPASFSSVGLLFQPLCAALLAWVLLAEPLGALQALGGAIVIAGVMLSRPASRRGAEPADSTTP